MTPNRLSFLGFHLSQEIWQEGFKGFDLCWRFLDSEADTLRSTLLLATRGIQGAVVNISVSAVTKSNRARGGWSHETPPVSQSFLLSGSKVIPAASHVPALMQSSGNLVSTERVAGTYFKYSHFPSTQNKSLQLAASLFSFLISSCFPFSVSCFSSSSSISFLGHEGWKAVSWSGPFRDANPAEGYLPARMPWVHLRERILWNGDSQPGSLDPFGGHMTFHRPSGKHRYSHCNS